MSTTKLQRVSSLSFSGLSDFTFDNMLDDPAGITRSSLTQESFQNDSGSHTWNSSFAGSAKAPQRQQQRDSLPPCLPVTPRGAPSNLWCDSTAHESAPVAGEVSMDMFDRALEVDVQQRQHRQRAVTTHGHQSNLKSFRARSFSKVDAESLSYKKCAEKAGTVEEVVLKNAPTEKRIGRLSCAGPATEELSRLEGQICRVSRGCQAASDQMIAAPLTSMSDSCSSVAHNSHGNDDAVKCTRREAQMEHLRELLKETRNLHNALWDQLQDLQRRDKKERFDLQQDHKHHSCRASFL